MNWENFSSNDCLFATFSWRPYLCPKFSKASKRSDSDYDLLFYLISSCWLLLFVLLGIKYKLPGLVVLLNDRRQLTPNIGKLACGCYVITSVGLVHPVVVVVVVVVAAVHPWDSICRTPFVINVRRANHLFTPRPHPPPPPPPTNQPTNQQEVEKGGLEGVGGYPRSVVHIPSAMAFATTVMPEFKLVLLFLVP